MPWAAAPRVAVAAAAAVLAPFWVGTAGAQLPPFSTFDAQGRCQWAVAPYSIQSTSMSPGFHKGEVVWTVCLRHATVDAGPGPASLQLFGTDRTVQAGDVVVVRFQGKFHGQLHVKRIIGLPGDSVEVRHGLIFINRTAVQREGLPDWPAVDLSGVVQPRNQETLPNGRTYQVLGGSMPSEFATVPPQVVPPERVFVIGDNRPDSLDSRLAEVGLIPFADVVGVVTTGDALLEALRDRLVGAVGGPRLERGL